MTLSAPPYLSPSSISTFQQCPLKYKYSKIDGIPEPPTVHTLLGNFVHDTLEALYLESPENRTMPIARAFARAMWDDKYSIRAKDLQLNEHDFRWKAWWCIENLWKLEDPTSVTLAGVECEVNGAISGVSIKGFIDRYRAGEDGSLIVEDYKTGKVPQERYAGDKFQQLFIYGVMLDALGIGTCSKVSLIYLAGPKMITRDLDNEAVEKTVSTIVSTKQQIDSYCEAGEFPAKPSNLCNWCHFKKICPVWKK